MDKTTIKKAFDKYGTDKGFQHEYFRMYGEIFNKIPAMTRLLEVGVKRGRSIAAWCELFPDAEIVGGDINLLENIIPEAKKATLIRGDSRSPEFAAAVGDGYDVIIDDGNHDVDVQWGTFLNLKNAWNHAYVIEDVMGLENAKRQANRLNVEGCNVMVYRSKLQDAFYPTYPQLGTFAFYSVVAYRK